VFPDSDEELQNEVQSFLEYCHREAPATIENMMEREGLLLSSENFRTTASQVLRIALSHIVSRYREMRQIKASRDSHSVVAAVFGSNTFRAISEEYELPPSPNASEECLDTVAQGLEVEANSQPLPSAQPLDSDNLVDYNFHDWLVQSYHPNVPAPDLQDMWSHNDLPDQLQAYQQVSNIPYMAMDESFGLSAGLMEAESASMEMEDSETAFWFGSPW